MPNDQFTDWFNAQKFRHFSASEFTSYFEKSRKGVKNSTPPVILWKNIVPTLRILDDLREEFGNPITILSSYRSPAYNRAVGGAMLSQHLDFTAIDFSVSEATPQEVFGLLSRWRSHGRFTGGLGLYSSKGFVHIDTRPENATWKG
jgi:uncharacterized protein YcbK (DUF882 family)